MYIYSIQQESFFFKQNYRRGNKIKNSKSMKSNEFLFSCLKEKRKWPFQVVLDDGDTYSLTPSFNTPAPAIRSEKHSFSSWVSSVNGIFAISVFFFFSFLLILLNCNSSVFFFFFPFPLHLFLLELKVIGNVLKSKHFYRWRGNSSYKIEREEQKFFFLIFTSFSCCMKTQILYYVWAIERRWIINPYCVIISLFIYLFNWLLIYWRTFTKTILHNSAKIAIRSTILKQASLWLGITYDRRHRQTKSIGKMVKVWWIEDMVSRIQALLGAEDIDGETII